MRLRVEKTALVTVLLLLSVFWLAVVVLPGSVRGATLYVGGGNPGNYTTIQEAIDDADPGDTVYVFAGTYYEHIRITKTINLTGEDKNTTIIHGNGYAVVVNVFADWVNISGFTVAHAGSTGGDSGIRLLRVWNCSITNNIVTDSGISIFLDLSYEATVTNNEMKGNGIFINGYLLSHWNTHTIDESNTVDGRPVRYWKNVAGGRVPLDAGQVILANCTGVLVENQDISGGLTGIRLSFSSGNVVANNTLSNGSGGISLLYSDDNIVTSNAVSSSGHSGIGLFISMNNSITENKVYGNGFGIGLGDSNYNYIARNNVSFSTWGGIILGENPGNNTIVNNTLFSNGGFGIHSNVSNYNRIYHNNLIRNGRQVFDPTHSNSWDNGYPSGGNYWSDYAGVDNCSGPNQDVCPDPDGIGDTPYVIDFDSRDRYPLMSPSGIVQPRPPVLLRAELDGNSSDSVVLEWSPSPDDMEAGLVTGYRIYRNTQYSREGLEYEPIAFLPRPASSFVDSYAEQADSIGYFYRVCAVDVLNRSSCAIGQAGMSTHPLSGGPNLVSIPLIQSNESIERVLQTVEYDKAWYYDSLDQEWKWHMPFKGYRRGLWNLNHTMGVWVNVTGASRLTVAGVVPTQTSIHLFKGWNLVSFPSFKTSYTVADLKDETGATRVEGLETMPPWPSSRLRVLGDAEVLQAGDGYWVRVGADTDWIIQVS
ncbi:MAG: right-handed parallel beta-helix repeat-containing protein [Thermoplasmata archaeon]|nr:right-handed parallel beta-helix repeat-containing protein [Thermoplasmata archaeon]